jgi:aldose 1-epimerase
VERTPSSVRVGLTVHPRPGYPFTIELEIEYSLGSSGLRVRTIARNGGNRPLPFGAGQHPYLSVGTLRVDDATLQLSADCRLEMDAERFVPTGLLRATAGTQFDFRVARPIGNLVLDDCFSNLARDVDGRARVSLTDPATGRAATLWMARDYRYVQVFTGDTLTVGKQRRGLAIEPMTCPANAFRTGLDLIVLQPKDAIALEWGITTT